MEASGLDDGKISMVQNSTEARQRIRHGHAAPAERRLVDRYRTPQVRLRGLELALPVHQ
jgi:hypothetical protein